MNVAKKGTVTSKSKWKILIECDAVNIKKFEEMFFLQEELVISREFVKGIILAESSDEMD